MKSHILPLLFICFLCPLLAKTQNPPVNMAKLSRNDWGSIMKGSQPLATKKSENIELRGSPFIYDTYEKGVIIVSDSLQSENNFTFKLNAEDNEIWVYQDKKQELVLTDKRIVGLDLMVAKDTHHFRKILLPDVKINPVRFVEVLFSGANYKLLKNTDKIFEAANYVDKGVAVVGRNYDNYSTVISYYILNDKKIIKKIALKKSDIYKVNLALVEKNREAINAFCKENQISNPIDEEEAVVLIQFLDGLK